MSLEQTERECAAGAVAPRVSLDDIKVATKQVFYFTADQVVGSELSKSFPQLGILTIALVIMTNGFIVIGKSAPASLENFNREFGCKLAYEDAVRQIWPLMGFALRDRLSENERP